MSAIIGASADGPDGEWNKCTERIFRQLEAQKTIDPAQFYTQNEIRQIVSISTRRITEAIATSQLKGRILGRQRIVLGKHLIEWLSGHSQDTRRNFRT